MSISAGQRPPELTIHSSRIFKEISLAHDEAHMTATLESDIIDTVAGLDPESLLALLRRRRPEALRHTEGSYQALLHPADPGGVTASERAAIARRVAELNLDAALGAH